MNPPPAEIGVPVADVETPALLIDLDAFDRNIAKMAEFARTAGVRMLPHAKTHKSTAIALRQIALGAVGQCVQRSANACRRSAKRKCSSAAGGRTCWSAIRWLANASYSSRAA